MTNTAVIDHRLSLLSAYRVLDTPPEQAFDDIAAIAAQLCGTPVALVSLVEDQRQWFKARVGFDPHETPIEQSVCAHDLDKPGILEIGDLTRDPRTSSNTLVTGPAAIRFYAGAPLIAQDGTAIGRLCVIDGTPRPDGLDAGQRAALEALARLVMTQFELRVAATASSADAVTFAGREAAATIENEHLRSEEARARAAHRAGRIGMFEIDVPSGEVMVSEEFCEIFGLPIAPSYHADALEALVLAPDRETASRGPTRVDGTARSDVEYRIRRFDDGNVRWIARRARFTYGDDGDVLLMHGTIHDVTERREQEEQQDLLNHEISHRLKNTLAMVQAIAMQTLRHVPDREPVDSFERRLMALSAAHDMLLKGNWRSAEIGAAAAAVIGQLGQADRVTTAGPPVKLGQRAALSFALLIHELTTNAMKYGALSVATGKVHLKWAIEGDDLVITWREAGGPVVVPPTRKGFGSRLIRAGLAGTGGVDLRYDPNGVSAEIRGSLEDIGRS